VPLPWTEIELVMSEFLAILRAGMKKAEVQPLKTTPPEKGAMNLEIRTKCVHRKIGPFQTIEMFLLKPEPKRTTEAIR
jgi:hypothetical protein